MSKITLRIPCKEPYAYIEHEIENSQEFPTQKILELYNSYYALMNPSNARISLSTAEYLVNLFNEDLSKEAWGKMSPDTYENLPQHEKELLQSIKRFYKRLPNDEE